MSTQHFSMGKEFYWQNTIYVVKRWLPGSYLRIENVATAEASTVLYFELVQALHDGKLEFQDQGKPAVHERVVDLSDYSPRQRDIAEYRLEVVKPLARLHPDDRTRNAFIQRVAEVKEAQQKGTMPQMAISVSSVYRWLKDYLSRGNDIRTLVPNSHKQGGKNSTRVDDRVEAIVQEVLQERYLVRERVKVSDALHEVVLRIEQENKFRAVDEKLPLPSATTVWRRIEALDQQAKLIAKRGRRAAKQAMNQYGQMEYPKVPLERVEIDHTRSDIIIVDEEDNLPLGRLTFTYCLDIATRYPLGYYLGFEPPSYLTVMECLHHAILPKGDVKETYGTEHDWIAYGVPATLIVDNGKEFIGRDLQDACNSLGIVLQLLPVKTPHFKATVERMFGTLNTGLLHTLPGTTFSNTFQRGDYDSLRFATLTLDELDKLIHTFLLGVYAESFHKGLGAVPARRWEAALEDGFFPRVPGNPEDLIILLGRVTHRVIRPSGIQFHSLRYNCPELAPLRARMEKQKEQQVKVKYHPGDLSQLHVYDPFDERYIEVPALAQDYTRGLSLWKHEVIRNFVLRQQDRVNIASLAHNKRKIQEIVEESKKRKKLKTRSRVARWDHAGKTLPSQPADKTVPSQTEHATLPLPQIDLNIDPDKLEEDGWGISHNLPVSMRRNAQ